MPARRPRRCRPGDAVAVGGTLDSPADETVSSRVQAICDWYGPSDRLTMPHNVLTLGKTLADLAQSNEATLLGGIVRDRADLARQASALDQVSPDDPPFLIMHGDGDPQVPLDQCRRLYEKLRAAGVEATLHVVAAAKHVGKAFQTPDVRDRVRQFFDAHLKSGKGK